MTISDAVTKQPSRIYNEAINIFGVSKSSIEKRQISNIEERLIKLEQLKEECE
jgi:hypothetical protein